MPMEFAKSAYLGSLCPPTRSPLCQLSCKTYESNTVKMARGNSLVLSLGGHTSCLDIPAWEAASDSGFLDPSKEFWPWAEMRRFLGPPLRPGANRAGCL